MILYVRHGQTDCNVQGIIQGQLDAPLNDNGIAQAKDTAEKLKDVKIDIIYSSPLSRAYKTAEIINEYHNVEIIKEDRLKEQDAGEATGIYEKDVTREMFEDFLNAPHKYKAESSEELYNRIIDFYKEIENSEQNILIVAHRGNWRMIHRYINKIEDLNSELADPNNSEIKVLKD